MQPCTTKEKPVPNATHPVYSTHSVAFFCRLYFFCLFFFTLPDYCSAYAVVAAVDFARRVRLAIDRINVLMDLDVPGFLELYRRHTGFNVGQVPNHLLSDGIDNTPIVLTVTMRYGIPCLYGAQDAAPTLEHRVRISISGYFRVPDGNIDLIRRLLASGFPLLASISVGRLFHFVGDRTVYYAPVENSHCTDFHAIALIGVGLDVRKGLARTFYYVRNSHGLE